MSLYLIPEMVFSNRALSSLQCKDGIGNLRSLKGLKVSVPADLAPVQLPFIASFDPISKLLWHCPRLEQLEILCTDTINSEPESVVDLDLLGFLRDEGKEESSLSLPPPLHLPHLRCLCLSAIPICPLLLTLLRTPLLALRHVMVTPYSDLHTAPQLEALLAVHGRSLISLTINTPRHPPILPTMGDVRPLALLGSCPQLQYLALDHPLPVLAHPAAQSNEPPQPHPLRVLTIPRPSARFLRELEVLLPRLPALTVVRARTVRWLRAGISRKALEAGVQGEMHEWRRRFARKGVRVVDGEWRDPV